MSSFLSSVITEFYLMHDFFGLICPHVAIAVHALNENYVNALFKISCILSHKF